MATREGEFSIPSSAGVRDPHPLANEYYVLPICCSDLVPGGPLVFCCCSVLLRRLNF